MGICVVLSSLAVCVYCTSKSKCFVLLSLSCSSTNKTLRLSVFCVSCSKNCLHPLYLFPGLLYLFLIKPFRNICFSILPRNTAPYGNDQEYSMNVLLFTLKKKLSC